VRQERIEGRIERVSGGASKTEAIRDARQNSVGLASSPAATMSATESPAAP